jgi:hypothetical protein
MRRLLFVSIVAVPVFIGLAMWNGAVAVLFGIAVLTYVLSTLYWRLGAEDPFRGAITRRDADRRERD